MSEHLLDNVFIVHEFKYTIKNLKKTNNISNSLLHKYFFMRKKKSSLWGNKLLILKKVRYINWLNNLYKFVICFCGNLHNLVTSLMSNACTLNCFFSITLHFVPNCNPDLIKHSVHGFTSSSTSWKYATWFEWCHRFRCLKWMWYLSFWFHFYKIVHDKLCSGCMVCQYFLHSSVRE